MPRLEAVLFDIDDTLFPTSDFARRARRNAVRAMIEAGVEGDEDDLLRELDEVIAEFSSNYDYHFDKLLTRLGPRALRHQNRALVVASGVVAYHDTKFREIAPFEDVAPLLADLRASGIRLGVVTNGWAVKQAEKLVRLHLADLFDADAIFISDQIGISKPNPKLYLRALDSLGIAPARAMYVGDHPAHDIAPPKSLGMIAVWSSRSARRSPVDEGIAADHEVADFTQLRALLRDTYGVALPAES